MRAVLFVDMVRPMRFPADLVNFVMTWAIAFSPFVLGSFGSYLRWERRFEAVVNSSQVGHWRGAPAGFPCQRLRAKRYAHPKDGALPVLLV